MQTIEGKQVYSVSEVNSIAKESLEYLSFWVEGEISSIQTNPNWYYSYFMVKDENNILPSFVDPKLTDDLTKLQGKKVLIFGKLTLFKNSEYKMHVFTIENIADGNLQKQFEELYAKLKKEGLFDEKHKKPLPEYPKRICIVTSLGSAGWNDFKTHTTDKFPIIELATADIRVEGPRAIDELVKILPIVDKQNFDIIVITRGGGAEESLMQVFNDEKVVRTIFSIKTPKIVAIGHEINTALAELVADVRASTPTDAANIITVPYRTILEKLEHIKYKLQSTSNYYFALNTQKLDSIYIKLVHIKLSFKDLPHRLATFKQTLSRQSKIYIEDANKRAEEEFTALKKLYKNLLANTDSRLENLHHSRLSSASYRLYLVNVFEIDVDRKTADFFQQYVQGFRHARFHTVITINDVFVHTRTAVDVV